MIKLSPNSGNGIYFIAKNFNAVQESEREF